MAFVAVEDDLGNVRSALLDAGFQVIGMTPEFKKSRGCGCE